MSPALNGSSAIRFEGSDAIEICDGITFDFYMGLPHMYLSYFSQDKIFHGATNSLKNFDRLNSHSKQDFTKGLVLTRNACNKTFVKLCSVVMNALIGGMHSLWDTLIGGTDYSRKRKWAVSRKTRHRQQLN